MGLHWSFIYPQETSHSEIYFYISVHVPLHVLMNSFLIHVSSHVWPWISSIPPKCQYELLFSPNPNMNKLLYQLKLWLFSVNYKFCVVTILWSPAQTTARATNTDIDQQAGEKHWNHRNVDVDKVVIFH